MSGQLMRPAARSAAVRPHSTSFSAAGEISLAPRPGSPAPARPSCCKSSLFFAPAPRPVGWQSYLVARACSQAGWEQLTAGNRAWEQEKRALSIASRHCSHVPSGARVRVIRARTCKYASLSLSLGTGEHFSFVDGYQTLALFPAVFPEPEGLGTWEQFEGLTSAIASSAARSNKIATGNALQRLPAGDAGRKFRASSSAGDLVDQAQLRIGGNLPFVSADRGHVGTVMLEGSAQGADPAAKSATRRKLGRLLDRPLATGTLRLGARPPRAPSPRRGSRAVLALDVNGKTIELRSAPFMTDRGLSAGLDVQSARSGRGPGGIRSFAVLVKARPARMWMVSKRAGVSQAPAAARLHDAGTMSKLRGQIAAVNGGRFGPVDNRRAA